VPAGRRFFLAPAAALVVAICSDRNGSGGAAPASGGGRAVGAQELNMVPPHCYTAVLHLASVTKCHPNQIKKSKNRRIPSPLSVFFLAITIHRAGGPAMGMGQWNWGISI